MQFEPETFKNHHHKHLVDYNGKFKRYNDENLISENSRSRHSSRGRSSDRSSGNSIVVSHKVHNNSHRYHKHIDDFKNSSASIDNNEESLTKETTETDDEESNKNGSLDESRGNFNLSRPQKKSQQPIIVYVGDGRSRVRRVVSTQTRHVTVVSYSTRHKETRSHTSHHVTTVSFPQKTGSDRATYQNHNSTSQNNISGTGGTGGYVYLQQQACYGSPHMQTHQLQYDSSVSPYKAANSNVINNNQILFNNNNHTPNMHKKGSIRNNINASRSTLANEYELSQDLLDKRVELIERKYGGVQARYAAIKIQRAFRHYAMVKKFASITAMAKADKRSSRRWQGAVVTAPGTPGALAAQQLNQNPVFKPTSDYMIDENGQQSQILYTVESDGSAQRVIATVQSSVVGNQRVTPARSMSLRERRLETSPMPRSQSNSSSPAPSVWSQSSVQQHSHPHVNLMHQQHFYQVQHQSPSQQFQVTGPQYGSQELNMSIDSTHSMNSSWNVHQVPGGSPYTPHYSAAQIYMRPRSSQSRDSTPPTSCGRKMPPEVPRRTSSITQQHPRGVRQSNGLCKNAENGSLSSVQSSGSESSNASMHLEIGSERSNSPHWKSQFQQRKGVPLSAQSPDHFYQEQDMNSHTSAAQFSLEHQEAQQMVVAVNSKISETIRKRQYRVGLNLFNKKPEKGITYLIQRGFLDETPQGVARFLITRKGLSRQMIGEYLGNLQNQFNMAVLSCFASELDLSGMQCDVALRKFQGYFRMPGEAQKIERLMEVFSQRYCVCNPDIVARLHSHDTIFVLAFAIIMLNTDLHTPNLKPERRMRKEDFIKNLRGIDDSADIPQDMLEAIYDRVKTNEFKPGSDHVTQVMKVQGTIVGKKPNLALPHRRLVCYCRLYEVPDINKKERPNVHQREVFLFNDLLVITKIFNKKKSSVTYTFRNSFPLVGMVVTLLDVPNYPYCIRLTQKIDGKVLLTFNARNEHDRCKFAEDLRESISEMDEMESLRIEGELDRQKTVRTRSTNPENRDSGVADVEVQYQLSPVDCHNSDTQLKRSALSNSLLDIHEQFANEKPQRRGSVGSLDSGMSISFQSTSASTGSRSDSKLRIVQGQQVVVQGAAGHRNHSRSDENMATSNGAGPFGRSTEV